MIRILEDICKHPVHPFPARMAPSIVWENLKLSKSKLLRVLDPMAGSGTSLVIARAMGQKAIGFDRDPLALLIAKVWCSDVDEGKVSRKAEQVLERARKRYREMSVGKAYPRNADAETRSFVRYWFDKSNRCQLAALSDSIFHVHDSNIRAFLWCVFSRLIIAKKTGVSLAMDVSHSRPHRVYKKAPISPFDKFEKTVNILLKVAPFKHSAQNLPEVHIENADARDLPLQDESIDLVITSPPYFNAIDYLRAHKFSLVWMRYSIEKIRHLRSTNIGAETCRLSRCQKEDFLKVLERMVNVKELTERTKRILLQYAYDMESVVSEIKRVLVKKGVAVFVIGNSTIHGTFIRNSSLIQYLANKHGLSLESMVQRKMAENRRYLPPPNHIKSGRELQSRMHEEVILKYHK